MDLNELLYAHQLAVMNANAPHANRDDRESHVEEAIDYADKIRLMPGALDVSHAAQSNDAASQSPVSGEPDECPSARGGETRAVLSAWESEGGATAIS